MRLFKKLISFFTWVFVGLFGVSLLATVVAIVGAMFFGFDREASSSLAVHTDHAVAVVDLQGEITQSDKFRKQLQKAVDTEKVKGIVIRIDSPGGSVGASEEIFRLIKAADQKKPVVCSFGNIAASGGLYSAMGCRKIFTNEGTLTGSIGVIFMTPDISSIAERFGFRMNVIKSGRYKDTGIPFREMNNEDRALLQTLINKTYEQFVAKVSASRKLAIEVVKSFADGRVILGEEAVKLGLVDEIGGLNEAGKSVLGFVGVSEEPEFVFVKPSRGLRGLFDDVEDSALIRGLTSLSRPQLLFDSLL